MKFSSFTLIIVTLFGIVSSLAFAKSSIVDLQDQILIPLKSCPERVWPNYTPLKDAEFVFTVPSENTSYLIKIDGTMIQVPLHEWGEEGLTSYSFIEKSNKKFVVFNVDDYESDNDLLDTVYHEAFHYLGQENLKPEIFVERGDVMPMNFHSNAARTMQIKALKAYLAYNNKDHLQKASYWEEVIKRDFLEDWKSNQTWDLIEGSAQFVGNYSLAISKLGCSATEKELLDFVLNYSDNLPDISGRVKQSYKAGQYAYMIARKDQIDDVFQIVSKSPVTEILNQYNALEEALDLSLLNHFQTQFGYVNSVVEAAKKEIKEAEAFLAISGSSLVGSFGAMGFYKVQINNLFTTVLAKTTIKLSGAQGSLDLQEKNIIVLQSNQNELCGKIDRFFLIPITNYTDVNSNDGLYGNSYLFKENGTYLEKKVMCPI